MAKNNRCTNCVGELSYKVGLDMLECERCGSRFPVSLKSNENIKRKYDAGYSPVLNKEEQVDYKCSTCGTSIVSGRESEITRCSSCGNTTLVREKSTIVKPDGIIPFEISRDRAAQIFRSWVGGRKFAPNDLKNMAKLEKISGIYTPIWVFNYSWIFNYSTLGVKKHLDSYDNEIRREYFIKKSISDRSENEVYSANSRMDREMGCQFEDYNFSKIRPYSTEYLLGYTGINTNVDIHNVYKLLKDNVQKENDKRIQDKLNEEYDYFEDFASVVKLKDVYFSHVYVPVWANHYTYKGKEYHCYINGQTGSAMGKAPKSFAKIAGTVFGVLAGIGAAVLLILKFL